MKQLNWFMALGVLASLTICLANDSKFLAIKQQLRPLAPGMFRVFIYRQAYWGALLHPDIILNGRTLWESRAGTVAHVDLPEGRYTIEVDDDRLAFRGYAGETKYVNLGFRPTNWTGKYVPQLIDAQYAEQNILDLDYVPLNLPTVLPHEEARP